MTRFLPLFLLLLAAPAAAQDAEEATPRGTYLVYADPAGSAFVSIEETLVDSGVWPLSFFYFQDGALQGTARMRATADCAAGVVSGTLTAATGPGEEALPYLENGTAPSFGFDRAAGGGDEAIVAFVCGTRQSRLEQAQVAIAGTPRQAAGAYAALRALGIDDGLARSLAIRDLRTAEPLIASAVPQALQAQVRMALLGL
ncbi:hypothetical protein [Parasphingopyxis marina]|uniref:Uncharacterized protein n=1 Tax=Parasphingopyxis marina TaxID=2761622 RepID=A0A842HRS2_9SPHN|nr:hypothetical protein [Parasphingopyxis marina]MBC2776518.1 hypothetical protein [Parasphingopyxis marina]